MRRFFLFLWSGYFFLGSLALGKGLPEEKSSGQETRKPAEVQSTLESWWADKGGSGSGDGDEDIVVEYGDSSDEGGTDADPLPSIQLQGRSEGEPEGGRSSAVDEGATLASGVSLPALPRRLGRACSQFIDSNVSMRGEGKSNLGRAGKILYEEISKNRAAIIGTSSDARGFDKFCPRFRQFSPQRKVEFVTYLMVGLAYVESSCKKEATAGAKTTIGRGPYRRLMNPHGPALGYFQLEGERKWRNWRGGACAGGNSSVMKRDEAKNIKCAVRILAWYNGGKGRKNLPGGYWGPLVNYPRKSSSREREILKPDNFSKYFGGCR